MSLLVTSVVPGDEANTSSHDGVGISFKTGADPKKITDVMRWVFAGNSQAHTVSIYSHTGHATAGTLLGSASVATAGQPAGSFASHSLAAPITLAANSFYAVLSNEFSGGDVWHGDTHSSSVPDASVSNVGSAQIIGGVVYINQYGGASYCPTNAVIVDATVSISPTDARFSPGNWSGDGSGRAGATYNQSSSPGAWAAVKPFTTTAASPSCTLIVTNQTAGSQIFYRINGGKEIIANVPTTVGIVIALPGPGTYAIDFYIEKLAQTGRNTLANSIKFAGMTLDSTATIGALPATLPWVRIIGDSTKEGVLADNFTASFLTSSSYAIVRSLRPLGYAVGMSAHGGAGYLVYGNSDSQILPYNRFVGGVRDGTNSRIDKISSGVSLYDANGHISAYGGTGTEPAMIVNNLLINDTQNSASQSDLALSIADSIARDRAAAPSAWLIYLVPACLYNTTLSVNGPLYVNLLKSAVLNYQTAHPGDTKVMLYDRGAVVGNLITSIHRDAAGYALDAQQEGPACFVTTWDNANNFAPTLASIKSQLGNDPHGVTVAKLYDANTDQDFLTDDGFFRGLWLLGHDYNSNQGVTVAKIWDSDEGDSYSLRGQSFAQFTYDYHDNDGVNIARIEGQLPLDWFYDQRPVVDASPLTTNPAFLNAISAAIEGHLINESDGQQLLAAIVAKINATDVNLAGLSTAAIASAVVNFLLSNATTPNTLGKTIADIASGAVKVKAKLDAGDVTGKIPAAVGSGDLTDLPPTRAAKIDNIGSGGSSGGGGFVAQQGGLEVIHQ